MYGADVVRSNDSVMFMYGTKTIIPHRLSDIGFYRFMTVFGPVPLIFLLF